MTECVMWQLATFLIGQYNENLSKYFATLLASLPKFVLKFRKNVQLSRGQHFSFSNVFKILIYEQKFSFSSRTVHGNLFLDVLEISSHGLNQISFFSFPPKNQAPIFKFCPIKKNLFSLIIYWGVYAYKEFLPL